MTAQHLLFFQVIREGITSTGILSFQSLPASLLSHSQLSGLVFAFRMAVTELRGEFSIPRCVRAGPAVCPSILCLCDTTSIPDSKPCTRGCRGFGTCLAPHQGCGGEQCHGKD